MKKEYNLRLILSRAMLFLLCLLLSLLLWLSAMWLASPLQDALENASVALIDGEPKTDTVL